MAGQNIGPNCQVGLDDVSGVPAKKVRWVIMMDENQRPINTHRVKIDLVEGVD